MNATMTRRASDAYDVLPSTDAPQEAAQDGLEFVPAPELANVIRAGAWAERDRRNEMDAMRVREGA